jgi:hypothetical protein
MRVIIKKWDAVAQWRWKVGNEEEDEDVCGICRLAYDACCPDCKIPGDDCPLRESLPRGGEPFEGGYTEHLTTTPQYSENANMFSICIVYSGGSIHLPLNNNAPWIGGHGVSWPLFRHLRDSGTHTPG